MEQLVDGDLEGDAAVLLEANLVPAAARSVRDDRVAAAVARDDVQIVGLSVAGLKSVTRRIGVNALIFQFKDLIQLFSWMCSIPLAMAARSVDVKAASMV